MEYPEFTSEAEYLEFLRTQAVLPAGFRVNTASIEFTPKERPTREPYRMQLSLVLADEPTDRFAAVFTRNAFPGAPVIVGRKRLAEPAIQGILVNNRIANVRSVTGIEDIERLTAALGRVAGLPPERLLSISTGIIGWQLPVPEMVAALAGLVGGLHDGDAVGVARAVMTTDSFPKCRRVEIDGGSIVAIAKGAGMIEPNMATMLVFILTDIAISRDQARTALARAVDGTFNAITVDGDMSTSDTALLLSSGRRPLTDYRAFEEALTGLCGLLAVDVVRNGEGAGHVIQVTVTGASDRASARGAGKSVANSPLVKTAIYGNDPNVGRILSSLGDYFGSSGVEIDPARVSIRLGGELVFGDGAFRIDRQKEVRLSDYLKSTSQNARLTGYPQHQRVVEIDVSLGSGDGEATVWGADLSDQYVHENADYRS